MTHFMNGAPGHIFKVVFVYPGCNSYIVAAKVGGKRVLRNILSPGIKIETKLASNV